MFYHIKHQYLLVLGRKYPFPPSFIFHHRQRIKLFGYWVSPSLPFSFCLSSSLLLLFSHLSPSFSCNSPSPFLSYSLFRSELPAWNQSFSVLVKSQRGRPCCFVTEGVNPLLREMVGTHWTQPLNEHVPVLWKRFWSSSEIRPDMNRSNSVRDIHLMGFQEGRIGK